MNAFDSTAIAYQKGARQSITYHLVSDPYFQAYYNAVGKLRRYEREHGLDDEWHGVVSSLSRYRYDAAHAPLPFNDAYFRSRLNTRDIEYVVSRAHVTRPTLAPIAEVALENLLHLIESDRNPILDEVARQHPYRTNEDVAFVLAHSRFSIPVRDHLKNAGLEHYDVIDPNALRRLNFWDRLIYVGAVRDFDDYVFSSPRTFVTEVFGYRWQQGRWEQSESFIGGVLGKSSTRQRFTGSSDAQAGVLANVDIDAIDERLREASDDELEGEQPTSAKVDARLHELFGGKAVLLEASERRTSMIIDLDADQDDRVRQVADNEIEEGMFIVLRTGDRGGYLIPIADQIIGQRANDYRTLLDAWKSQLRRMESKYGPQGVVNKLRRAGSTRASYQNLRNWMSSQSIAPEADEDYHAIAVVCDMDSDFPLMKTAASHIRRAHVHAGQKVRRRLLEVVQGSDIEEIEREGMKHFELPEFEGAQLTAYRIERRSGKTAPVSMSTVERVFDLDVFTR
jgi:hypothetical protein